VQQKFTHGGNIYEIQRQKDEKEHLFDFSANINPLGLNENVQYAIEENIAGIIHYPDPEGRELREALSHFYGLDKAGIVLGNGAAELLYVLFQTIRPRKILIPVPSFSEYERAARAAKAEVVYHRLSINQKFSLQIDAICDLLHGMDCLVLGNPNNPTGNLLNVEEIKRIVERAKKENCLVVVDESFMDFVEEKEQYSCMSMLSMHDNLFVLQSLTKIHAIPGLRLGFAATSSSLANKLDLAKDPWNVNFLAQKAGVAALQQTHYLKKSIAYIAEQKDHLYTNLKKIEGLMVYEPTVNFILLDLRATGFSAAAFRRAMLEKNILIRDCSNYPGLDAYHVRIAVKTKEDNDFLLCAIRGILEGNTSYD
jgi:threonine-phosphate decarboxylase